MMSIANTPAYMTDFTGGESVMWRPRSHVEYFEDAKRQIELVDYFCHTVLEKHLLEAFTNYG